MIRGWLAAATAAIGLAVPAVGSAEYIASAIASGLNNPRGLAFGPDGALYVTEAGVPISAGPTTRIRGEPYVYGQTGSITRIQDGVQQRVLTGLPSLSSPTTSETSGPQGIAFDSRGTGYIAIGLGADPNVRSTDLAPGGTNLGQVVTFGAGTPSNFADVARLEAATNPDGGVLESNPFRIVSSGAGLLVTDAGANTLVNVAPAGTVSTVATFPARALGGPRATESVPTGLAIGPDGAIYVGELTGVPFAPGSAQVYRIAPGGSPTVCRTGFTNISDIAFGSDGSLYVLELDSNGLAAPGSNGALIRVAPDGTRTTLLSQGLVAPTGLAIGPDGAFYVSNFGVLAGGGQVLRISAVSEPGSLVLLAIGSFLIAASLRPRRR